MENYSQICVLRCRRLKIKMYNNRVRVVSDLHILISDEYRSYSAHVFVSPDATEQLMLHNYIYSIEYH